ncbi:MAG: serine/threonine-protein kinase [Myxococcota bacterium]
MGDSILAAAELASVKRALLRSPPPPPVVGRIEVRGVLGRGGGGIVLDGYDPLLQRRVALKVLPRAGAEHNARLLREAQALARVRHPHVVEVFHVGVHDGRSFMAMALVGGTGLREWLDERPSPRQRLSVLVDVVNGLAAVHAAGLAHGDVKPENVIVDANGRGVLIDFGLAASGGRLDRDTALGSGQTEAGGTAGYQAPEVDLERPPDAKSDQYSLCVMATELMPSASRRLQRAFARGRSVDPSMRFASIEALVQEIGRRRARTGVLAAAAFVPLVAYAAWPEAPVPCDAVDAPFAPAMRQQLEQGLATHGANADNLRNVDRRLTAFSDTWLEASVAVCERSRSRGHSTTADDDARACLASSARELASLVDLLTGGEPVDAVAAVAAVTSLRPVARCEHPEAGAAPPEIQDLLVRARQLSGMGRIDEGLESAREAERLAYAEAPAPVRAEVRAEVGFALVATSAYEEAEPVLSEAYQLARQWRRDAVAAECATALADVVGIRLARNAEGQQWLSYARALMPHTTAAERPRLERIATTYEGLLALNRGDVDDGIAILEALVAREDVRADPDPMNRHAGVQGLAIAYAKAQRWDEAEALFRRSYETVISEVGPCVFAADEVYNLGLLQLEAGRPEPARATLAQARRLYVQTGGLDHAGVGDVDTLLADINGGRP